ncbi:MAG: hypothetical protein R3Y23_06770 [Bacillota bacterium]
MLNTFIIDTNDPRNKILLDSLTELGYDAYALTDNKWGADNTYVLSPSFVASPKNKTLFRAGSVVYLYSLTEDYKQFFAQNDITVIKVVDDEDYTFANSILTAEGALMHAIEATDLALADLSILILGYGHLGKALYKVFYPFNHNLTFAARSMHDISEIKFLGCRALTIAESAKQMPKYDLIINTIPAELFDAQPDLNPNVVILELASKIYPFDYYKLSGQGIAHRILGSLPSKVAKVSASNLLLYTILKKDLNYEQE